MFLRRRFVAGVRAGGRVSLLTTYQLTPTSHPGVVAATAWPLAALGAAFPSAVEAHGRNRAIAVSRAAHDGAIDAAGIAINRTKNIKTFALMMVEPIRRVAFHVVPRARFRRTA